MGRVRMSRYTTASTPGDDDEALISQSGSGVAKKTTLSVLKSYFGGSGGSLPTATAENDVIMAAGSPLDWVKKTIAELSAALGLSSKADKVATSPAPTGKVAEFDSGGNLAVSSKVSSDIHASGSDNQDLSGLLVKASNLSDVGVAATAFGNIKQAATDTATGVVELATSAETISGTDAVRTITPATLRAVIPEDIADTTLSGTPVVLAIIDKDNNTYYFKGYPTKV